jgi:hypothetical protein
LDWEKLVLALAMEWGLASVEVRAHVLETLNDYESETLHKDRRPFPAKLDRRHRLKTKFRLGEAYSMHPEKSALLHD